MARPLSTLEEHLGYLTDARKLATFDTVLRKSIHPGDLVADLGCGSGILGLMALEAGAALVWGIDRTDAIEIARETMRRAGLTDRYICIKDSSFRTTLPEPVDLIVCDHVGYFGIDYGIVAMLGDARRRFLKPRGRIMPERIELVLAAAALPEMRAKAEAWAAPEIPEAYHWLGDYGINTKYAHSFAPDELCSEPMSIGQVDLMVDQPDHLRFAANLIAVRDATVDGLAGWFACDLGAGIRMSNSPLAEERIDRPQAFLPFGEPLEVSAGDRLDVVVSFRHDEGLINWAVTHPRSGRRLQHSTWRSRLLSEADLRRQAGRPVKLDAAARARAVIYGYIDGIRSSTEIEQAVLRDHPDLLPSPDEIARFVRKELARSTSA